MSPNFGHLKIINFSFGTNEKLINFGCPNTQAHYSTIFLSFMYSCSNFVVQAGPDHTNCSNSKQPLYFGYFRSSEFKYKEGSSR